MTFEMMRQIYKEGTGLLGSLGAGVNVGSGSPGFLELIMKHKKNKAEQYADKLMQEWYGPTYGSSVNPNKKETNDEH